MIIVTGGAGFIGSAFVWKCNQEGQEDILIVDTLKTSEKWRNLVGLSYADYIHKDVFIERLIDGDYDESDIEAIVHMGACSATTELDADYLMENNYRYTQILAEWCVENDVRFIYASSAATYGNGENGFEDSIDKITALRPINRYGYSKQFFDLQAMRSGLSKNIVGLKFFNVFGPNEYHKDDMRSVVCKAHKQILETGEIKLFKSYRSDYVDGGQKRDFVYVKDCVEIMWWLLNTPTCNGIFNIGTGQARTWNELASAVFHAMNITPNITYIPMPESIQNQYQYFTQASMTKLQDAGCPIRCRPLEEAVQDYVKIYLNSQAYLDLV